MPQSKHCPDHHPAATVIGLGRQIDSSCAVSLPMAGESFLVLFFQIFSLSSVAWILVVEVREAYLKYSLKSFTRRVVEL